MCVILFSLKLWIILRSDLACVYFFQYSKLLCSYGLVARCWILELARPPCYLVQVSCRRLCFLIPSIEWRYFVNVLSLEIIFWWKYMNIWSEHLRVETARIGVTCWSLRCCFILAVNQFLIFRMHCICFAPHEATEVVFSFSCNWDCENWKVIVENCLLFWSKKSQVCWNINFTSVG